MIKKRRRRRRRRGRNGERAGRACFERPNRLLPSNFRGLKFQPRLWRRNSTQRPSCPQPGCSLLDKPPTHTLAQSHRQTLTLPPPARQPGDQCGKNTALACEAAGQIGTSCYHTKVRQTSVSPGHTCWEAVFTLVCRRRSDVTH